MITIFNTEMIITQIIMMITLFDTEMIIHITFKHNVHDQEMKITRFNTMIITTIIILIIIIKMITPLCAIMIILISWRLRLYRQRAPIGRIGANRASTNHNSAGDWEFGQSRLG